MWEWEFSSGGYIKVYTSAKTAWFSIDNSKIKVAWTEGTFTSADWDQVLVKVKEAKKILKRIRRI